jgi:hypothetical protein
VKIKVMRAFLHKGERQEIGKMLEVSDGLGIELIFNGRAERVSAEGKAKSKTMSVASVPELVTGVAKTEKETT